jgi:hypothetical protein
MLNKISLSREAVRIVTLVTVAAQVAGYFAAELASLNEAGQLSVVALIGLVNATARKFVYSEESHVIDTAQAYLRGAEDQRLNS